MVKRKFVQTCRDEDKSVNIQKLKQNLSPHILGFAMKVFATWYKINVNKWHTCGLGIRCTGSAGGKVSWIVPGVAGELARSMTGCEPGTGPGAAWKL